MTVQLHDLLSEPASSKEENRVTLLRSIMARPGSQAYLSRRSGLSAGTVSAMVQELAARHHVVVERSGRDRTISVAQTAGAAVGIELGLTHTAVIARRVEQSFDEAAVTLRQVGAAMGPSRWVEDVSDAVLEAVDSLGEEEITTIGLGLPGIVDPRTGELVLPTLPPWDYGVDPAQILADALRSRTHGPRLAAPRIVVDNDANLAAYAESIYAFDDATTLVAIKASTSIGAGIIVGGRIFRGSQGVAGEIGHVVVQPGGRFCTCGGRGCLETLIGADALIEQAKIVLGYRRMRSPASMEELIDLAVQGNLVCQRVLQEAGATLGSAIGNLCNIINPEVVVISGGLARAAQYALEPCRIALLQTAMRTAIDHKRFVLAASGIPHPVAHGALVIGLEGTRYSPERAR